MRIPLTAIALLWTATVTAQNLPMPPRFTAAEAPEQVLDNYPLGVVTELAAHSHHGHPDHKITLPNRREGWVYEVFGGTNPKSYVEPRGTEQTIRHTDSSAPRWSYTLVIDTDGTVIDLLYDDQHSEFGLSALQLQRRADPAASKLPGTEHGPHFAPGGPRAHY